MYTAKFTEQWELVDVVYGDAVAADTETNSGWNLMENYHRVVILVHPVDVNDALDVDIEQDDTGDGSNVKTVDSGGKDITVATTDTAPSAIELRMEELDVSGGFEYLQVEVTTANTGGGDNEFVVEIWGLPRYRPASTSNLDSVTC